LFKSFLPIVTLAMMTTPTISNQSQDQLEVHLAFHANLHGSTEVCFPLSHFVIDPSRVLRDPRACDPDTRTVLVPDKLTIQRLANMLLLSKHPLTAAPPPTTKPPTVVSSDIKRNSGDSQQQLLFQELVEAESNEMQIIHQLPLHIASASEKAIVTQRQTEDSFYNRAVPARHAIWNRLLQEINTDQPFLSTAPEVTNLASLEQCVDIAAVPIIISPVSSFKNLHVPMTETITATSKMVAVPFPGDLTFAFNLFSQTYIDKSTSKHVLSHWNNLESKRLQSEPPDSSASPATGPAIHNSHTLQIGVHQIDDLVVTAQTIRAFITGNPNGRYLSFLSKYGKFSLALDLRLSCIALKKQNAVDDTDNNDRQLVISLWNLFSNHWTMDSQRIVDQRAVSCRIMEDMTNATNQFMYTKPRFPLLPSPMTMMSGGSDGSSALFSPTKWRLDQFQKRWLQKQPFSTPITLQSLWNIWSDPLRAFQNSFFVCPSTAVQRPQHPHTHNTSIVVDREVRALLDGASFLRLQLRGLGQRHVPKEFVVFHGILAAERIANRTDEATIRGIWELLSLVPRVLDGTYTGKKDPSPQTIMLAAGEWIVEWCTFMSRTMPYLADGNDQCNPHQLHLDMSRQQQTADASRRTWNELASLSSPSSIVPTASATTTISLTTDDQVSVAPVSKAMTTAAATDSAGSVDMPKKVAAPTDGDDEKVDRVTTPTRVAGLRQRMLQRLDRQTIRNRLYQAYKIYASMPKDQLHKHSIEPIDQWRAALDSVFPEFECDDCETLTALVIQNYTQAQFLLSDFFDPFNGNNKQQQRKKKIKTLDQTSTTSRSSSSSSLVIGSSPIEQLSYIAGPLFGLYVPVLVTCAILKNVQGEHVDVDETLRKQLAHERTQHQQHCSAAACRQSSSSSTACQGLFPFQTQHLQTSIYDFDPNDTSRNDSRIVCHAVTVWIPVPRLEMWIRGGRLFAETVATAQQQTKLADQSRTKLSANTQLSLDYISTMASASTSTSSSQPTKLNTGQGSTTLFTNTYGCQMYSSGPNNEFVCSNDRHTYHHCRNFVGEATEYSVGCQNLAGNGQDPLLSPHMRESKAETDFSSKFMRTFPHSSAFILRMTRELTPNYDLYVAALEGFCLGTSKTELSALFQSSSSSSPSKKDDDDDADDDDNKSRHQTETDVCDFKFYDAALQRQGIPWNYLFAPANELDSRQSSILCLPLSGPHALGFLHKNNAASHPTEAAQTLPQHTERVGHAEPSAALPPTKQWISNNSFVSSVLTTPLLSSTTTTTTTKEIPKPDKTKNKNIIGCVRLFARQHEWQVYGEQFLSWLKSVRHSNSFTIASQKQRWIPMYDHLQVMEIAIELSDAPAS
jgi:hypothetical protein